MNLKVLKKAELARENSYSPYSKFRVGAALLLANGDIFTGCNIEASSYSMTCCAERVALFKAISEGNNEFKAIAIVGGFDDINKPCMPCGACRQVMAEFCPPDFKIILKNNDGFEEYTLSELLPKGFLLK
ncbi:MAG: cytidine deaminase [Clostridiales bacterium]|nr:cytidine deaminase [Clostridiales bacterium]